MRGNRHGNIVEFSGEPKDAGCGVMQEQDVLVKLAALRSSAKFAYRESGRMLASRGSRDAYEPKDRAQHAQKRENGRAQVPADEAYALRGRAQVYMTQEHVGTCPKTSYREHAGVPWWGHSFTDMPMC